MEIKKRPKKSQKIVIDKIIIKDPLGVLKEFKTRLEGIVDLDIFYYKQNGVEFIPSDKLRIKQKYILAQYDIIGNRIVYNKNSFKDAIMHELFHLASTLIGKDTIFSGLSQMDKRTGQIIGIGVNEAFTCMLDDTYFGDYTETKAATLKNTYKLLKDLMYYIVVFLSQERVEEHYFKADLKSFVEDLSQYMGEEKTTLFIMAMDNLHYGIMYALEHPILSVMQTKMMFDNYRYVMDYIGELYLTRIVENYYTGELTETEYNEAVSSVKSLMKQVIKSYVIPKIHSKKMTDKEFDAYLSLAHHKYIKKYT